MSAMTINIPISGPNNAINTDMTSANAAPNKIAF